MSQAYRWSQRSWCVSWPQQRIVASTYQDGWDRIERGEPAPGGGRRLNHRFITDPSFPKKASEKAWEMVREFLTPEQWDAFKKAQTIELQNKAKTHRLIINRSGEFTLFKGDIGEGIVLINNGYVKESLYPLGDEMAALIALFRYDTQGMIENWDCGTFTSAHRSSEIIEEFEKNPLIRSLENIILKIEDSGIIGSIGRLTRKLMKEVNTC